MKILMVNKFLYPAGGAENYVFKLGGNLAAKGHEVEYFGMKHPDNVVGNRWNLYTATMDFHSKTLPQQILCFLRVVYSREAKNKMKKLLEYFHPDVVHINNFNYQLTPTILLAIKKYQERYGKKIKVVYTAHDPQLVCPNHYMYCPNRQQVCEKCLDGDFINCIIGRCIHDSVVKSCLGAFEAAYWRRRKIYSVLDAVVCPSFFIKEKLDRNPELSGKTMVLRNFVETDDWGIKGKGDYVLYFGRYSEEKGIRTLLKVCRELPDIPFAFAGNGPLEELIDGFPNVRKLGYLSGRTLEEAVCGARFSVCPSECSENCPFSVLESIKCGTPVLSSDRGGLPELIEEGHTGWLFPAGNSSALREKIKQIWNSGEPERFGENCQRVPLESLEDYGNEIVQIYLASEGECSSK